MGQRSRDERGVLTAALAVMSIAFGGLFQSRLYTSPLLTTFLVRTATSMALQNNLVDSPRTSYPWFPPKVPSVYCLEVRHSLTIICRGSSRDYWSHGPWNASRCLSAKCPAPDHEKHSFLPRDSVLAFRSHIEDIGIIAIIEFVLRFDLSTACYLRVLTTVP